MKGLDFLIDCLFPLQCAACRKPLPTGTQVPLCDSCRIRWEEEKRTPCTKCGLPMPHCRCLPGVLSPCVDVYCRLLPYGKEKDAVGKAVVLEAKEHLHSRLASFLAEELGRMLPSLPSDAVVAYVPRNPQTKRTVGYDQAQKIARALGKEKGCRVVRALRRSKGKKTEAQKTLHLSQRLEAVQGSYLPGKEIGSVKDRFVVLVDDVLTSGATLSCCANILKEAGAQGICAVTVAYTLEQTEAAKAAKKG